MNRKYAENKTNIKQTGREWEEACLVGANGNDNTDIDEVQRSGKEQIERIQFAHLIIYYVFEGMVPISTRPKPKASLTLDR